MNITFSRNTLRGFCEIEFRDLNLCVKDVAIHEKNGSRWAQLPAKPMIDKDGNAIKDAGKIKYASIMDFGGREQRDAFSTAVVKAVLAVNSDVFEADPF